LYGVRKSQKPDWARLGRKTGLDMTALDEYEPKKKRKKKTASRS